MYNLVGTLLVFAATTVWADWVQFAQTDETVYYFDPATVRKEGNLRTVWWLYDLKDPGPFGELSIRFLKEFDCNSQRVRILSYTVHSGPMATGKVLFQTGGADKRWVYVPPKTTPRGTAFPQICGL